MRLIYFYTSFQYLFSSQIMQIKRRAAVLLKCSIAYRNLLNMFNKNWLKKMFPFKSLFLKGIPLLMNRKNNFNLKWTIIMVLAIVIFSSGFHPLKDLIAYMSSLNTYPVWEQVKSSCVDWATSLSLFTFLRGRRKWQPTPAFLPGESQGRRSLMCCRLWGHTEPDTTEAT